MYFGIDMLTQKYHSPWKVLFIVNNHVLCSNFVHCNNCCYFLFVSVSGKIENLIKPGSSFEHVARWLTFCGAQPPFCYVSEKLPSQASDSGSQLGVGGMDLI